MVLRVLVLSVTGIKVLSNTKSNWDFGRHLIIRYILLAVTYVLD